MSITTRTRLWSLLSESFIPVILVIIALFGVVIYVQIQAELASNQIRIIDVGSKSVTALSRDDEDSGAMLAESTLEADFNPELEKARDLIEKGNWKAAEKVYLTALESGETARLRTELGRIYLQQGKPNKALSQLEKAITLQPPYPSAWFYHGVIMNQKGNYKTAIKDYTSLLRHIPHHYEGQINLALIYLKQKQYVEAEKTLAILTEKVGGSREAKAQYFLAIALSKQSAKQPGNTKKSAAIKALKRAIRLKPDYIDARIQMALLETDITTKKGYEAATKKFDQILALKPNYPTSYFHLAKLHADSDHPDEAINTYRKAIQYDPGYRIARKNLGLLLLSKDKWLEAEEQFRWLANNFPDDPVNRFFLGRVAYGRKHYADAIKEYEEALTLARQNYPEAHLNLGLAYNRQDSQKNALKHYKEALQYRNHYPQAWFNIGLIHLRDKKWQQAKHAFNKALEQDSKYEQAWFNLALIHTRENDTQQAIQAYERALAIRPNYRAAALNLAVRYADINQFEKAITLYKEVLLRDPTYTSAWINLGITYGKINNPEEAEKALRQAIRLEPENIKPRKHLAQILNTLEHFSDAENLLRETIEMDMTDIELRLDLAETLAKSGNTGKAINEIKIALRLEPNNKKLQNELHKLQTTQ